MSDRPPLSDAEFEARIMDTARICELISQAAQEILNEDARAGRKVPIWRDGEVVWVTPMVHPIPQDAAQALPDA